MADGMGFVNPVEAPFLERILREEGHGRDLPRKRRDEKAKALQSAESKDDEELEAADTNETVPLTHIDLRI